MRIDRHVAGAMLLALGFLAMGPARADGGRAMPAAVPKAYVQECASCHAAYPPGLLPQASWKRIMGNLDRHYGTDASLDAPALAQLGDWLQGHAAVTGRAAGVPPEDRITRSDWFLREHRKVDAAVWRLAGVRSPANCAACHSRADQGSFRERELITPTGLDLRPAWRRGS